MMGEYLLYYNGVLFGGIYDDRLLVKIVENNKKYNMQESIPYESAKPMYLVDDVDNQESLRDIVLDTCKDLKK
jgi:TfoX/Sxy family transcriptional regulator of competence genes